MNHTKSIRAQILIPVTLTFLVLFLSFLFSNYAAREADIADTLNREYGNALSLYKELLFTRAELMTALSEPILRDPALKRAMRHKDRNMLYKNARPYLKKLSKNGVTHLYFHAINAQNFLRVHQPDRHGDIIHRDSLHRAMQFGTPAYGTELGPLGTITLRLVIPWKEKNSTLGFIELGTEVNDILSDVALISNIDYLTMINKSALNHKAVESGDSLLRKTTDWNQFPDRIMYASTLNHLPLSLSLLLSTKNPQFFKDYRWKTTELDSKSFAFKSFPFNESNGREIGNFILLFDITQQTKRFHYFLAESVLFGSLLSLILFSITWRILGRVDKTVIDAQQKLANEVIKVSETNHLLATEVGERQRAEQSLIHLNEHLEEKIIERTRHLEITSQELEKRRDELESAYSELKSRQAVILHQDKMASIGLLAAGVAHDINNPIGFVTNNLEELHEYINKFKTCIITQRSLIQETASPELLKKLQENYKKLEIDRIFDDFDTIIAESLEGTGRISDIVKNLRNFSRVDDAEFMFADINECIKNALKITQHELKTKAVVQCELSNLAPVYCCPQQMNQAFMNLLVNAAHAIEKRGEVIIRTWSDPNWVYITIADSGCGIPDEILPKIFEPFFTTKEINKGTGLGLNIVTDIITQHRGKIHVDSRQGNGTTFTIQLPNITKTSDA